MKQRNEITQSMKHETRGVVTRSSYLETCRAVRDATSISNKGNVIRDGLK